MPSNTLQSPPVVDGSSSRWRDELRRDLLNFHLQAQREAGDVVEMRFPGHSSFQISQPVLLGQIFQGSREAFRKGERWDNFRQVVGQGVLTAEPDQWIEQRRTLQPTFLRRYHARFSQRIGDSIRETCLRWQQQAREEKPVKVVREMSRLTLRNAGHTLFGTELGELTDRVSESMCFALPYIKNWFDYPWYKRTFGAYLPQTRHGRFRRAMREMENAAQIIIERREELRIQGGEEPFDLLAALLDGERPAGESQKQRTQIIRDTILTFFFTGHETTAAAVSWTFHLLSQHPEIESQLHQELDRVLGGRVPTQADLAQLTYLRQVVQESMRIYPPVWIFLRETSQPEKLGEFSLPANASISILPYVVHRHLDYWDEPERFDPDRFTPQNEAKQHPLAYIPFGGGPRQCMGKHTALLETQLLVAGLAQNFQLKSVPGITIRPAAGITLWPSHNLPMTLHPRH